MLENQSKALPPASQRKLEMSKVKFQSLFPDSDYSANIKRVQSVPTFARMKKYKSGKKSPIFFQENNRKKGKLNYKLLHNSNIFSKATNLDNKPFLREMGSKPPEFTNPKLRENLGRYSS